MDIEVRTLQGPEELDQAWLVGVEVFNDPPDGRQRWIDHVDPERTHGVFVEGELVAVATVLGLGQWFGGRCLPMGGVAAVGVRAEHRGRGFASAVMQALLPAMRARGEVVSTLSPATTRLYRGMGWEVAGVHGELRLPTRSLAQLHAGAVSVRRATFDDVPGIKACYERVSSGIDGFVERPDWYWRWQLESVWHERVVSVVDGDSGDVDGYVVWQRESGRPGYGIFVREVIAVHPDAAVALWRMIGSSASQVTEVRYSGPPEDALLYLLPEQDIRVRFHLRWMLRLVDAAAAVAGRGFPEAVRADVDLEVRDRLCDWNDGRWRLSVRDGHGHLERGGTGDVQLAVGPFSSLFSGYASARSLARLGLLTGGGPRQLSALDAAFAGPTPWMPDEF